MKSKSKEALERYYSNLLFGCGGFSNDKEELEALKVIKQDLERLEQLEDNIKIHKETIKMQHNQIESLQSSIKEWEKYFDKERQTNFDLIIRQTKTIDKLKKVIEIIKSKGVQESFLKNTKNVNEYNKAIKHLNYFDELEQEEYDLLKEHLGND